MTDQQDSYEEYKNYLCNSLGRDASVEQPNRPMNPYMRFFLERSCQERKKGDVNWNDFSKKIAEEWKGLSDGKKKYYE